MEFQFMTAKAIVPPYVPLPAVLVGYPVSSTAKVLYARLLSEALENRREDEDGVWFVRLSNRRLSAMLLRSMMTVKRVMGELEEAGLVLRVRERSGGQNRIYVLLPLDWPPIGEERLDAKRPGGRNHGIHEVKRDKAS